MIGEDVHIGNGCVIGHDVAIGDGAEIGDLTAFLQERRSSLTSGGTARRPRVIGTVDRDSLPEHPELGRLRCAPLQIVGYFFFYNFGMVVGLLPIFPAFYVLYNLDNFVFSQNDYDIPWAWVPVFAWPSAFVLVLVSMAIVVAVRWIALPRIEPGRYSIFSGFYFRKWIVGLSTETILETLNSLYATVFMRNWYRLMGAKVGRGTEISASFAGRYPLIEMGENNFIGDEAVFGDEDVYRGWMTLERMKTGDRCFFGNSAVVAQGCGHRGRCPDRRQIAASGLPARACRRDLVRQSGHQPADAREGYAVGQLDLRAVARDAALAHRLRSHAHLVPDRRHDHDAPISPPTLLPTPFGEARWGAGARALHGRRHRDRLVDVLAGRCWPNGHSWASTSRS